ncbi:hypothetical protein ACH47Z_41200 [Streptomyces sp. NPDC020192]|uniref:hypothetical protein n=1 Tax=Streptomyces sp. NPDC020192 TaxID=3365066 RepID=UPI0037AE5678
MYLTVVEIGRSVTGAELLLQQRTNALDEGGDLLAGQDVFRCGARNGAKEFASQAQTEVGLAHVEGAGLTQCLAAMANRASASAS